MKYSSESDMISMKNVYKDPWNTFHVSVTLSELLPRTTGGQLFGEISKILENLEIPHIPACGSTGRRDRTPLVAIGSATKFGTSREFTTITPPF